MFDTNLATTILYSNTLAWKRLTFIIVYESIEDDVVCSVSYEVCFFVRYKTSNIIAMRKLSIKLYDTGTVLLCKWAYLKIHAMHFRHSFFFILFHISYNEDPRALFCFAFCYLFIYYFAINSALKCIRCRITIDEHVPWISHSTITYMYLKMAWLSKQMRYWHWPSAGIFQRYCVVYKRYRNKSRFVLLCNVNVVIYMSKRDFHVYPHSIYILCIYNVDMIYFRHVCLGYMDHQLNTGRNNANNKTFIKNNQTNKTPPKKKPLMINKTPFRSMDKQHFYSFRSREPFQHLIRLIVALEINDILVNNRMWLCLIKGYCTCTTKIQNSEKARIRKEVRH